METIPLVVELAASIGGIPSEKAQELWRTAGANDFDFVERLHVLGLIPESDAYRLLAKSLDLPFENPDALDLDPVVLSVLPKEAMAQFQALPLRWQDGHLVVGLHNPTDLHTIDALQELARAPVMPTVVTPTAIAAGLRQRDSKGEGIEALLARLDLDRLDESAMATPQKLREVAGDNAIVDLVNLLIDAALRRRASDIHIESGRTRCKVRMRVDGCLEATQMLPKPLHSALISRIKVLADLDIAERRKPQDGQFRRKTGSGRIVEFRVSTLPAVHGEKAVLRVLDRTNVKLDLTDQGMTKDQADRLRAAASSPNGLVLVTGPTGSGKTTTLYGLLHFLHQEDSNLITVEDPVEYELENVTQVQVDPKAGRTFATVLRSMLRQDPDVVMVGEIRDQETGEIAVHAALTGHMVLSTLHTNSAIGAVTRLVDMGVEPYLLAPTITAVVAQRLVRRLCPDCAKPAPVPTEILARFGMAQFAHGGNWRRADGCGSCRSRGFIGRVPIYEILFWNDDLARLLAKGANEEELLVAARAHGFRDLLVDGIEKAWAGLTTIQEAMTVVRSKA
jgi:type II secretory ATPase GspE/PulE/Tfp pilus assembly ATPase PilB-like protein